MERKPPQDTESRHADKYIVRFPDGMRDQLKALSKANSRTLNAEIIARLQASLDAPVIAAAQLAMAPVQAGGGDYPPGGQRTYVLTPGQLVGIADEAAQRAVAMLRDAERQKSGK